MLCFVLFFNQKVFKMAAGPINSRSLFVPCSIPSKRSQYSPHETQTSLCASSPEVSYYTLETSEPESIWSQPWEITELAEGLPYKFLFLLLQAMTHSCFFLVPNKPSSLV